MKTSVCFLCLKRIQHQIGSVHNSNFWKFIQQYLPPPVDDGGGGSGGEHGKMLLTMITLLTGEVVDETQVFCEDCEVEVNSICKLYKELVAVQLNLAWKLGELGRLMEGSKKNVSSKLGHLLMKSLADQLSIDKAANVDELRSWLMKKCQQKGKETLPDVHLKRQKSSTKVVEEQLSGACQMSEVKVEVDDVLNADFNGAHDAADWFGDGGCEADFDSMPTPRSTHELDDDISSPANFPCESTANQDENTEKLLKNESTVDSQETMMDTQEHGVQDEDNDKSDSDHVQIPIPKLSKVRRRTRASTKKIEEDEDDSPFEPDSSPEESSDDDNCSSPSDSDWSSPPEKKPKKTTMPKKRGRGRPRKNPLPVQKSKQKSKKEKADSESDEDEKLPCPQCDKTLRNSLQLEGHLRTVHESIKCNLCSLTFIGQAALKLHAAEEHKGEGNFTCPTCCKPSTSYYNLSRHMRRVHNNRRFDCKECGKTLKSLRSLRTHMNAIHHPTPYQCPYCPKVSPCEKYHKRHIFENHPETLNDGREMKYHCPQCSMGFNQKQFLEKHERYCGTGKEPPIRVPKEEKPPKIPREKSSSHLQTHLCPICGKMFRGRKKTYYAAHVRSHEELKDAEPTFQCHLCPTAFHFRHQLTQHVRRVHNRPKKGRPDRPKKMFLKCMFPSCQEMFPKGDQRKEHILTLHSDEKKDGFMCEICGRLFIPRHEERYKIHVEAHFGDKPFQCPHCPSTFCYTRNFDEHIRDYHSEKEGPELPCTQPDCKATFRIKSHLKRHIRVAHGIRRPMGQRRLKKLMKKEAGPSPPNPPKGEKPKHRFLCDSCGKGFNGKPYYDAHVLTHDPEIKPTIQCDQCPSVFHGMVQLRQHIRRVHFKKPKGTPIIRDEELILQCLFPSTQDTQKVEVDDGDDDLVFGNL